MPISPQLNYWIAESGSWQSFIDFKIPEEDVAQYKFYPQSDDFYLSLMAQALELLKEHSSKSEELLSVAKGLEIFSLGKKRDYFEGVSYSNNVLFAAGLYYLANFSASAWILATIYPSKDYSGIDLFISNFLKRLRSNIDRLNSLLNAYLRTGNYKILNSLISIIQREKEKAFNEDAENYYSFVLAESLLLKFYEENIWNDLLRENNDVEHWKEYVLQNIRKKVPIWSFFPSQKFAIQKGLLRGETCSLQMPTSSGKTSISELVIYDEFKKNSDCKILYLAPFRALASELKQSLAISLGRLGIKSKTIYGGNLPTLEERNLITEVNLLIATPEKFLAIEDIFPNIYNQFTTIICDEGHLLDDDSRGLSYELLLSRLKSESEIKRRFIFISAIIPNISVINAWLGGSTETLISSTYRPTELEYAFVKDMNTEEGGFYLDVNPFKEKPYNYQLYKYIHGDGLKRITKNNKVSKKAKSVAIALKATDLGTVALFAPHKKGNIGVEGLASEAISQLKDSANLSLEKYSPPQYLEDLVQYLTIVFGLDYLLTDCAKYGVLFHHGDFPQDIREMIEDALRKDYIRLAICTNTLAEGVNLPIKTIVIHSTQRFNPNVLGKYEYLKIRDLKNLVGRAGRAGRETKGLIIVPHESDFAVMRDLILDRNVEEVRGQLHSIINSITKYLQSRQLVISSEILDSLNERFQELLDSIDLSMLDLLSEEVEIENLQSLVADLVKNTLSFYQADVNEKVTLNKIFEIRAQKLIPIINEGEFKLLKNSGTNIRLFDQIRNHFDFNNPIWDEEFQALNEPWLTYILDDGIFQLNRFTKDLEIFNERNDCNLSNSDIKQAIQLWMQGYWFKDIREQLGIETHQALRLINSLIGFSIQGIVSATIRIKELLNTEVSLRSSIVNWTAFLQYGLNSQLQLNLIEMGLVDRVAVLALSNHLELKNINSEYQELKIFLSENKYQITKDIQHSLPNISVRKIHDFLEKLGITDDL